MKKAIISVICILIGALIAHNSLKNKEAKEEALYNGNVIEVSINK